MTATLEQAPPLLVLDGQLTCDIADCSDIFDRPVDRSHPALSPRKQLQKAAADHGWQQSVAGLNICPRCAAGPLGIFVPGWAQSLNFPVIERHERPPVMNGDDEPTTTIPAVVEPVAVPAGAHPYAERTSR